MSVPVSHSQASLLITDCTTPRAEQPTASLCKSMTNLSRSKALEKKLKMFYTHIYVQGCLHQMQAEAKFSFPYDRWKKKSLHRLSYHVHQAEPFQPSSFYSYPMIEICTHLRLAYLAWDTFKYAGMMLAPSL